MYPFWEYRILAPIPPHPHVQLCIKYSSLYNAFLSLRSTPLTEVHLFSTSSSSWRHSLQLSSLPTTPSSLRRGCRSTRQAFYSLPCSTLPPTNLPQSKSQCLQIAVKSDQQEKTNSSLADQLKQLPLSSRNIHRSNNWYKTTWDPDFLKYGWWWRC